MEPTTIRAFSLAPVSIFKSDDALWTRQELRKQTKDTLQDLLAKNTWKIETAHPYLDIVYSHKTAKFLFAIAKILNLPNETKYLALEIFQSVLLCYLDRCMASGLKKSCLTDRALKICARKIKEATPLRVLACVLVASKLTSHKNKLAPTLASSISWLEVHPRLICKYETQILQHLEFRCCRTSSVLDYIGLAVSVAGLWHGNSAPFSSKVRGLKMQLLSAESVQETAVELLDFVCLNREQVYEKLCHSLSCHPPRRSTQFRAMFARVLADNMLLAGSIVVAAAAVLAGQIYSATVAASLCRVFPVTPKDLLILATCVLECVNLPLPLCDLLRRQSR